jgi:hypothetical protein
MADLFEALPGKKGGSRPVPTFVDAESGKRKKRDHGDETDGEQGKRGENLRERKSLLPRKERPHAYWPKGW